MRSLYEMDVEYGRQQARQQGQHDNEVKMVVAMINRGDRKDAIIDLLVNYSGLTNSQANKIYGEARQQAD